MASRENRREDTFLVPQMVVEGQLIDISKRSVRGNLHVLDAMLLAHIHNEVLDKI